jgi:hypothetical protein
VLAQSAPVVVETNVQAVLYAHLHLDGGVLLGKRFNSLHNEILLVHLRRRSSLKQHAAAATWGACDVPRQSVTKMHCWKGGMAYNVARETGAVDGDTNEIAKLDVVAVVGLKCAVEGGEVEGEVGWRSEVAFVCERAVHLQAQWEIVTIGAAQARRRKTAQPFTLAQITPHPAELVLRLLVVPAQERRLIHKSGIVIRGGGGGVHLDANEELAPDADVLHLLLAVPAHAASAARHTCFKTQQ